MLFLGVEHKNFRVASAQRVENFLETAVQAHDECLICDGFVLNGWNDNATHLGKGCISKVNHIWSCSILEEAFCAFHQACHCRFLVLHLEVHGFHILSQ